MPLADIPPHPNQAPPIFVITGDRGAGKTTLCRILIDYARAANWQVSGLLCPARIEGDWKTGIEVLNLRSAEQYLLARRAEGESDPLRIYTPDWVFDRARLEWGNQCLNEAVPTDLLVVDELGPLELEQGVGWQSGIRALDSGQFHLALVVVRPELIRHARARWPQAESITLLSVKQTPSLAAALAEQFIPEK